MTEAEAILKMIETVDPSDKAKLNEIDSLVCQFLHPNYTKENGYYIEEKILSVNLDDGACSWDIPDYTRSRDALKGIRPEGWYPCGHYAFASALGYSFALSNTREGKPKVIGHSTVGGTEELAELHAIIQAIQHDREQVK